MRYASVCSGIEAVTVAWHPLGWKAAVFCEIEKFPSAVLAHHYPDVPNHGDFTTLKGDEYGAIDVLVGGTPCQDFSVAGLRAGLDGKRGGLTIEFARLAHRMVARSGTRKLVWENVSGVLSIDHGRAFAIFLSALCGRAVAVPNGGWRNSGVIEGLPTTFGLAYRVLDAQYLGVPQRRRRVFVVGHLGDWRRAAAVLFERHSLSGHPAPRREAGQVAPTIPARSLGGGGLGTDFDCDGGVICMATGQGSAEIGIGIGTTLNCNHEAPIVTAPLTCNPYADNEGRESLLVTHSLRGEGFDASEDGTGRGTPLVPIAFSSKDHGADAGALSPTLRSMGHDGSHANGGGQIAVASLGRCYCGHSWESHDLRDEYGHSACSQCACHLYERAGMAVRRLTPVECERLQGFPDNYTRLPGKIADGPRYKALGNSMAVPVMAWIGEQIQRVEAISA